LLVGGDEFPSFVLLVFARVQHGSWVAASAVLIWMSVFGAVKSSWSVVTKNQSTEK
jgi:hypothetical protein